MAVILPSQTNAAYGVLMTAPSHPRLRRVGRRAVAFFVPYAVAMALIPRLGLVLAVLIGLVTAAVVQTALHVMSGVRHDEGRGSA
ncbi:hypothetical protein V6N00_05340 [Tersicoccus sp. MR15.9]|uniref:hypothetical protein n=1 Tax=Tersicoccus mangrovi TaxID=3121635 RepID=UPI002FE5DAF2